MRAGHLAALHAALRLVAESAPRAPAESLQRIIVRRTLAGEHPQNSAEIIGWLEETVAGWNTAPTPFV